MGVGDMDTVNIAIKPAHFVIKTTNVQWFSIHTTSLVKFYP